MYKQFLDFISSYAKISIIQAENPDGDSLGSALALDCIINDSKNRPKESDILNHQDFVQQNSTTSNLITHTSLFCPVDIPKYLRYYQDWSLIEKDFDYHADAYVIVDTAATVLLTKVLEDPLAKNLLYTKPVLIIDHHETPDDLDFPHQSIIQPLPACCDLIFQLATDQKLPISAVAANYLLSGLLSDTLGLSSASVTSDTFRTAAALTDLGASVSAIEEARHEFMKKSPRILSYKAELIQRVQYFLDGKLALVHIPWEDIRLYSDEYNPNVLILEELRMVEGVEVAIAIKTYPDGKITGKIRTSLPIAEQIAGFYGGGGHKYASGFRAYDLSCQDVIKDLINFLPDLLDLTRMESDYV